MVRVQCRSTCPLPLLLHGVDVQGWQQDAGAGLAITSLDNDRLRSAVVQLVLCIGEMRVGDNAHKALRWDQPFGTEDRVAEHRALVSQSTILLWGLGAKVLAEEGLQSTPLATREHDVPQMLQLWLCCPVPGNGFLISACI
jgi:hypothetical protein